MSIHYCLDCVSRAGGCEIAEAVARHFGNVARLCEDRMEFELPGVSCVGFRPDQQCRELIRGSFGFDPTHTLVFGPDKFDLHHVGLANMLRVTVALMKGSVTDAVLLQNGERPLILRRNGRMTLQDDACWTERLARAAQDVGGPYAFEAMPVV